MDRIAAVASADLGINRAEESICERLLFIIRQCKRRKSLFFCPCRIHIICCFRGPVMVCAVIKLNILMFTQNTSAVKPGAFRHCIRNFLKVDFFIVRRCIFRQMISQNVHRIRHNHRCCMVFAVCFHTRFHEILQVTDIGICTRCRKAFGMCLDQIIIVCKIYILALCFKSCLLDRSLCTDPAIPHRELIRQIRFKIFFKFSGKAAFNRCFRHLCQCSVLPLRKFSGRRDHRPDCHSEDHAQKHSDHCYILLFCSHIFSPFCFPV